MDKPFSQTLKTFLKDLQRQHSERVNEALQAAAADAGLPPTARADLEHQVWLDEAPKKP